MKLIAKKRKKTSKQRREQRKRAKVRKMELVQTMNDLRCLVASRPRDIYVSGTSFPPLKVNVPLHDGGSVSLANYGEAQKQEEEHNMSELRKVEYLKDRLWSVKNIADGKLQQKHGLRDDDRPSTAEELVKRIKDGMYVIPENAYERCFYYTPAELIRWRDPAKVEDKAGYETAAAVLQDKYVAAKDAIVVLEPAEGLKALQAFESDVAQ